MKEVGFTMKSGNKGTRLIGLRLIVTTAAAVITTVGVLSVGVMSEMKSRETLSAEVETRLMLTARNLALLSSSALLGDFPELTLHPLVKEMQAEQPALELVTVLDHQGVIQGSAEVRDLGTVFQAPEDLTRLVKTGVGSERLLASDALLLAESPVTHPSGEVFGKALVGMRRSYINELVARQRAQHLVIVSLVLATTLAMVLLMMSRLLRPVASLRRGLERIGRGDLETPLVVPGRTEFTLLADSVNTMAADLKRAQAEMLENERMSRELELAREIQSGLLPEQSIVRGDYVLRGAHRAAAEVGGDYYDYMELPDGRVALAVADVSGKGLAGCLIMSMLSALWRSHACRYDSPRDLLLALDAALDATLSLGQFVTMFVAFLNPESHELVYASAAHSPLLLFDAEGGVRWRQSRGIPLGAISTEALASTLEDETLRLSPGQLMLQFTDGISEAFNPGGEQFELERIEACVQRWSVEGEGCLLEALRKDVSDWVGDGLPSDDETLLVLYSGIDVDGASSSAGGEAYLARAREQGAHLPLRASLSALNDLHEWLPARAGMAGLDAERSTLITTAVYEAAANIVEHGYGLDGESVLDLWWVQSENSNPESQQDTGGGFGGYFILRDEAPSFDPSQLPRSDLSRPEQRLRGRGLGLDIICGVTSRFDYFPATSGGNLTVLAFECHAAHADKEPINAG